MRNPAIDLARLVASFFIVAVHVGYYNDYSHYVGEIFRGGSRWALPLFFLITGYFIGASKEVDYSKRINKIIGIFVVASILFVPYAILKKMEHGPTSVSEICLSLFSVNSLVYSDYFHLWFLPSLIIGMLLTKFAIDNFSPEKALILSGVLLILTWLSDLYAFFDQGESYFYFFRLLVSFPLIYIGYYLAKRNLTLAPHWAIILFASSVFAMALEVSVLAAVTGHDGFERQFPLFCSFAAAILLLGCAGARMGNNFYSDLGAKYSLGIYLFHPIFLPITKILMVKTQAYDTFAHLLLTFMMTLAAMILLDKVFPRVFRLINGGFVK